MNIFSRLGSFFRYLRSLAKFDPERDWLISLISGLVVLAGIVVWNVWTFNVMANESIASAVATTTTAIFNKSSLTTIHTIFANRAAEEAKYETGVYHYADPSL